MVTTASVNEVATGFATPIISVPTVPAKEPISKPDSCVRCGSRMFMGHDEPQCVTCGHADYTHTRDIEPRWARTSLISAATRYIARYVGISENLLETLTHVRLVRKGNRAVYSVTCPFCECVMEESSLSGKRSDRQEERFRCDDGHRVSIIPRSNGMLGWR